MAGENQIEIKNQISDNRVLDAVKLVARQFQEIGVTYINIIRKNGNGFTITTTDENNDLAAFATEESSPKQVKAMQSLASNLSMQGITVQVSDMCRCFNPVMKIEGKLSTPQAER